MAQPLKDFSNFYLVGIKGVAMAAMAQMLCDAGKKVAGADLPERFVTQKGLEKLGLSIDTSFDVVLSPDVECVIYTAAHNSQDNPLVQQALKKNIPIYTHAEALGWFFNDKIGVAVCGVGGKTTISAMIAFILEKLGDEPSYSVGVGGIPGLDAPSKWRPSSKHFVVEADEYVTDPSAPKKGIPITPRFKYLQPSVTVSTNIRHDHPDVYPSLDETKTTFLAFFNQRKPDGPLIYPSDEPIASELAAQSQEPKFSFGTGAEADYRLTKVGHDQTWSFATLEYGGKEYQLKLKVPGLYNLKNAAAAVAAVHTLGFDLDKAAAALSEFNSTDRRFEFKGTKDGVRYFDDYAHHPHELEALISTALEWFGHDNTIIAFQPHTFSRTRELFSEFVAALSLAPNLILLDIFASAREAFATDISAQDLATAVIKTRGLNQEIPVLADEKALAEYLKKNTKPGQVVLTVGAGTIYKAFDLI